MTQRDADIERLYRSVDNLAAQVALGRADTVAELRAYRKELNGNLGALDDRLREVEDAENVRKGAAQGRAGVGRLIVAAVGVCVGLSTLATYLAAQFIR